MQCRPIEELSDRSTETLIPGKAWRADESAAVSQCRTLRPEHAARVHADHANARQFTDQASKRRAHNAILRQEQMVFLALAQQVQQLPTSMPAIEQDTRKAPGVNKRNRLLRYTRARRQGTRMLYEIAGPPLPLHHLRNCVEHAPRMVCLRQQRQRHADAP